MSDKKKDIKAVAETEVANEKSVPQKTVKQKKAVKKPKRPNFFVRLGRKFKEIFSELKKVTWPTFPTVIRQTGVVLVVVLFFLVLVFAFDSLLSIGYTLLK